MPLPWLLLFAFEGPLLEVPWACGETRLCTQGHNGGSHTGNSAWAWDFDAVVGDEIVAAAAGTVSHMEMSQTEGGCDPSFGNFANYVIVDHGDGTATNYHHLLADSSPLEVGDSVVPGMLIGRIGLTGYVCGDHLHFQVQGTCGSYYCQSVPAEFADYGDPVSGQDIESTNCPACTLELAGGVTLVSELDPGCFVRQTTFWASTMEGDDGHHFTTIATDAPMAESTGAWRFVVTVVGEYRVEVFVPSTDADSTNAVYQVHHAGGVAVVAIDQAAVDGWQELGSFAFAGGPDERVQLDDNTGESSDLQRKIAFDAVRFTFVPARAESTGGGSETETSAGSEGASGDPSVGEAGSASGSASASAGTTVSGGTVATDALPETYGEREDRGNCACTSTRARSSVWALLLALGVVRRRSRHGSTTSTWS